MIHDNQNWDQYNNKITLLFIHIDSLILWNIFNYSKSNKDQLITVKSLI